MVQMLDRYTPHLMDAFAKIISVIHSDNIFSAGQRTDKNNGTLPRCQFVGRFPVFDDITKLEKGVQCVVGAFVLAT